MKNPFKEKESTSAIRERYGQAVLCNFFDDKISLIKGKLHNEELFENEDYQKLLKKKKLSFVVDKETSLDSEKMKKVFEQAQGCHVLINLDPEEVYSSEELKKLKENFNMSKEYGPELEFEDGFTLKQAEKASNYIEKVANKINQMEVDGKKLTQFERYMAAYREVTQYIYKFEDKKDSKLESRSLNFVLGNGEVDKIVCVGYASMLKAICDRIGVPCATISVQTDFDVSCIDEKGNMQTDHRMCQVILNDKESGVEGIYYADPTNDSKKESNKETTVRLALIRENDLEHIYGKATCVKANDNELGRYAELYKNEKEIINNKIFQMFGEKCVDKIEKVIKNFFSPENPDIYSRDKRDEKEIKELTEWVGMVLEMQIGSIKESEKIIPQIENFDPDVSEATMLYCLKNNNITEEEFRTRVFSFAGQEVKKAIDNKLNKITFFDKLSKERYALAKKRTKDVESNKMCIALDKINRAEGMTKEESRNKTTEIMMSTYEVADLSAYRPIDLLVFDLRNHEKYNRDPNNKEFKDLVNGYLNGAKGLYQRYRENEQKKEVQGIEEGFEI